MNELSVKELFDLDKTIAKSLLEKLFYPWEVLPLIKDFIFELGVKLSKEEYDAPKRGVWIAKSAEIASDAVIEAPCVIDKGAKVRHSAFLRGSVIVGSNAVVGNSCELKNCILFDRAQVPHFNYVGDSVLGFCAHMGAGAITSNVKSDKSEVTVSFGGGKIVTN